MRILVVSDTHRYNRNLIEVIKKVGEIDLFIHLGDAEGDEHCIEDMLACRSEFVAGNNDFFCNLPKEKEIEIGPYKVLLTHGHYYYVSMGTEEIKKEARIREFDIVMFGHTHRPVVDIGDDVTVINPGSLSYPRQDNRRPSYILMEIDKQGEAHYTINYL